MNPSEASVRRRWLLERALPTAVGILAVVYFARKLVSYWPSILALSFTSKVVGSVIAAATLHVLSGLIDAWAWGWLLRNLSVAARTREAMAVFLVSQFAKYIPGSVVSHLGRIALARAHDMPSASVLLSIVIESGFALGAGAVVTGASVLLGATGSVGGGPTAWSFAVIALAWLSGAVLLRAILAHPPAFFRRVLKMERPVVLERSLVVGYFLFHISSYAVLGMTLALLVAGLGPHGELWRIALAGIAGWFAGYVVPGAPAGLGVREATLTALLTPLCGPAVAVSAALLSRFSALVADGLLFLIGIGLRPPVTSDTR